MALASVPYSHRHHFRSSIYLVAYLTANRFDSTCISSANQSQLHKLKGSSCSMESVSSTHRSCSYSSRAHVDSCKRKKHQDENRQELGRNKNLPICLGRRHTLLTTFVPLPVIMAQRFLGKEQCGKGVEDISEFGFDGLGKNAEEYAVAKVLALAQVGDGAVLFLGVGGYEKPLRMVVGAAEAMAVLTAAQERTSSRPVTHEAWGSTLSAVGWKVDRVAITSLQHDLFYSRVVLTPTEDTSIDIQSSALNQRSVDMRPSDGIALALRCHAPLFVSKNVAEKVMGQRAVPEILQPNRPQLQAQWILPPLMITRNSSSGLVGGFVEPFHFLSLNFWRQMHF